MPLIPKEVMDRGRVLLYGAVYDEKGNRLPPLRWAKSALRFANDLAGQPLCSAEELARRQRMLEDAERAVAEERAGQESSARREPAPVALYITDQDHRTRKKIEEIFKGRDIPFAVHDVTDKTLFSGGYLVSVP